MATTGTSFRDELESRAQTIRDAFGVRSPEDMLSAPLQRLDVSDRTIRELTAFNIEWHIIPSTALVPFDDSYLARMYARRSRDFDAAPYQELSVHHMLRASHQQVQGTIVGVETTQK